MHRPAALTGTDPCISLPADRGRLRAMWWILTVVGLAVAAWRFAEPSVAATAAIIAVLAAWILAGNGRGRRALPFLALFAAALAALRLWGPESAFPCSLRCAGLAGYGTLFGLPVLGFAVVGCSVLALAAWRRRHLPVRPATAILAWSLAGGSLAYIGVSCYLGVLCQHCFAVHTVILAAVAGAGVTRWRVGLALVIAAALGTWIVLSTPTSAAPTSTVTLSPSEETACALIDANRSVGPLDAPITLELIIDLHCPVCARRHQAWMQAARAVPGLRITTRLLVRPGEPAAAEFARWIFGSGSQGDVTFQLALAAVLGAPVGTTIHDAIPRLAEVVETPALAQWMEQHAAATAALLASDQQLLHIWKADRQTPTALLRNSAGEITRVSGDVELTPVLAEARARLAGNKH